MYNSEYFQNTNETNISGNNNYVNQEMDVNVNSMNMNNMMNSAGSNGVQERVVHRTFVHEVPHDCFFMIDKNIVIYKKVFNKVLDIFFTC